jgi:hypothetical protein
MAKQIINTGLAANDGTGDPIRTAMIKVNANFTELYNANANTFSGSYADLTNKPTIPTDLTDLGIVDGTIGQILTTDGAGGFTFEDAAGVGGGIALTDLSVGAEPAASGNGGLAYSANTGVFTYTPPVIPTTLINLGITDGANGQVLTTNGAGAFTFATVGGALQSRTTKAGTTASLANNARGDLNITGFKGYALLAIQTDKAAWVRIYANAATRSADASRLETVDPTPDAGVIAEVITTGAQTVLVSPSIIGYNLESPVTTTIPCSVTNKSGSAGTVAVTLTVLQLEA